MPKQACSESLENVFTLIIPIENIISPFLARNRHVHIFNEVIQLVGYGYVILTSEI